MRRWVEGGFCGRRLFLNHDEAGRWWQWGGEGVAMVRGGGTSEAVRLRQWGREAVAVK